MKNLLTILFLCSISLLLYSNSPVFDNVKKHYSAEGDSLKIKAVEFIEENIDIHFAYEYLLKDSIGNVFEFNEFDYNNFNDSKVDYRKLIEKNSLHPVKEEIYDRNLMSERQLIEIIDRGFELWSKPWNRNLSFENFCDYLLAYRVQYEPLEYWQADFDSIFSPYAKFSSGEICNSVNSYLNEWFISSFSFEDRMGMHYFLSPSQMLFRKQGYCGDMCNLSAYAMRSLGVACSVDFTPAWATSTGSHSWCTFIDESNRHRPFEGVTGGANDFIIYREPSKVFRISYRKQTETLPDFIPLEEIPEGHLRMQNIIDVTENYWRTATVETKIEKIPANNVCYVGVFNGLRWFPVDWSLINEGDKSEFKNLSVGAVYMPLKYEGKKSEAAGYPFLIRGDKTIDFLVPDKDNLISISITENPKYLIYRPGKKYTFYYWDNQWIKSGTQTASEDKFLVFDSIPSNTLYLLLPEYSQRKERLFTVDNTGNIERW